MTVGSDPLDKGSEPAVILKLVSLQVGGVRVTLSDGCRCSTRHRRTHGACGLSRHMSSWSSASRAARAVRVGGCCRGGPTPGRSSPHVHARGGPGDQRSGGKWLVDLGHRPPCGHASRRYRQREREPRPGTRVLVASLSSPMVHQSSRPEPRGRCCASCSRRPNATTAEASSGPVNARAGPTNSGMGRLTRKM